MPPPTGTLTFGSVIFDIFCPLLPFCHMFILRRTRILLCFYFSGTFSPSPVVVNLAPLPPSFVLVNGSLANVPLGVSTGFGEQGVQSFDLRSHRLLTAQPLCPILSSLVRFGRRRASNRHPATYRSHRRAPGLAAGVDHHGAHGQLLAAAPGSHPPPPPGEGMGVVRKGSSSSLEQNEKKMKFYEKRV